MELKQLDTNIVSFEANGTTYFIESKLSIYRFRQFLKLEVELAYQGGFTGVMKSLNQGIKYLNETKWVDAAVTLSNTRDALRKLDLDMRVPAVDICSLFINKKDEDRRTITDEMLAEKQKDFEAEGIPIDFFLTMAKNLVVGFKENFLSEA